MSELVGEIRVFETIDGNEVELKRSRIPVSRFNDNVRQYQDGTLWAYTWNGRPVALIKCSTHDAQTGRWWQCVTSLSTNRLRGERSGRSLWMPEQPGVEYHPLRDADPPAPTTMLRHRQVKQLARRFNAHQFWNPGNQRFELRLLPRPVLVYSDESAGVLDGGVFVFTHGVSPALALVVEAIGDD